MHNNGLYHILSPFLLQQAPAANGNAAGAKRQRVNYKEASDSEDDVPLKDKVERFHEPK